MVSIDNLAKGIDVSHHRGSVDWGKVKKSGVSFGIVKCTDGTSFIDRYFDINWTRMRQAGVIRGAYHFFRPGDDPKVQANLYLRMVGDIFHESDLPPVLDFEAYPLSVREAFESLTLEQRFRRAKIWLNTVENAVGKVPIIYTNISTWKYFMGDTTEFSRHPLWIANYQVTTPNVPANNWNGRGWTLWQTTDQATVPGVNGDEPPVDFNVYHQTEAELREWVGFAGTRALPPLVTNQEMMEAMVRAAHLLGKNPTDYLEAAGLTYLATPKENLPRPYDGPAVQDLPISEPEQKIVFMALEEIAEGLSATWENITNQDMINAFYAISSQFHIAGWDLIELAQLEYLIHDRDALYTGPKILDLPGLTLEQKAALMEELELAELPVEEPVVVDPPPVEDPPPPSPDPVIGDPVSEPAPDPAPEPEPIPEPIPEPEDTWAGYSGITNQMMINAFYTAGTILGIAGWTLIERAELTSIAENRSGEYVGPRISTIITLNVNIQARIREVIKDDLPELEMSLPYPGLLNQDIVNMFYRAAARSGEDGWQWIKQVKLDYMGETRQMRYEPYRGPFFEDLVGLNIEQISFIQEELQGVSIL